MKNSVYDGGEENAAAGDEDEAAEEGIKRGEDLGGGAGEVGAVDGALTAHEHRGFEKGIQPGEPANITVACHAKGEGEADEDQGDEKVAGHAPQKDMVRGDGLAVVLEGHPLFVHRPKPETKKREGAVPKISEKVGSVRRKQIGVRR